MVTDVFGLYLYEKNGIVVSFSLISASEERLEKSSGSRSVFCTRKSLVKGERFIRE